LLVIHSKDEQDFISEYLFKTHKLVENVWIGLRNRNGHFEWIDNSTNQYTNWRSGNPTNKLDFNCVQLELNSLQWTEEPCNKKGLVVCQKLPQMTLLDVLKQVLELKQKNADLDGRLKKSEEKYGDLEGRLEKTLDDLTETKEGLKKSEEKNVDLDRKLKKTEETRSKIINIIFNKNVSHYQLFTDPNGKNKAFLIPVSAMRKQYDFNGSVNLCKNFNSTLIEIESKEKQNLLETFLRQTGIDFKNTFKFFWINAERNSSGKWKWLKSDNEFTFTNWYTNNPVTNSDSNYIYVSTYSTETFGKWGNFPKTVTNHVICEHTFEF